MVTLREFRKTEGLTLKGMAARLGVHLTTVQKWEIGSRMPDARAIVQIEQMTAGQVRAASFVQAHTAYRRRRSGLSANDACIALQAA